MTVESDLDRARGLREAGRFADALPIYERLLRGRVGGDESSPDLRVLDGLCACLLNADEPGDGGTRGSAACKRALALAQGGVAKRRGWAVGWVRIAQAHLALGAYSAALAALQDSRRDKNLAVSRPVATEVRATVERARLLASCGSDERTRGNAAYARGEMRQALAHYRRALAAAGDPSTDEEAAARLHSNAAAALCRLASQNDPAAASAMAGEALAHADRATALTPSWPRAHDRRAGALALLGRSDDAEAARSKARALEAPPGAQQQHQQRYTPNPPASSPQGLAGKAAADALFRAGDYAGARDGYSAAIAEISSTATARDGAGSAAWDEATLLSNRSACHAKLGEWQAALRDAQAAQKLRPRWPRAWARMGAALHGLGRPMDAYCVYCKGSLLCSAGSGKDASKGGGGGGGELAAAMARVLVDIPASDMRLGAEGSRFRMHGGFPPERTRIFTVSDLHVDQHGNIAWIKRMSKTAFQNGKQATSLSIEPSELSRNVGPHPRGVAGDASHRSNALIVLSFLSFPFLSSFAFGGVQTWCLWQAMWAIR